MTLIDLCFQIIFCCKWITYVIMMFIYIFIIPQLLAGTVER